SAVASIIAGLTVVYQKVNFDTDMSGNPLLMLTGVLVIAAIQFILMGLLAELLVRTYHESQGRPTYVIKEIIESSPTKEKKK
ncbi:MAG: glycosyltransferase, partial [Planctomycetota bacterium]